VGFTHGSATTQDELQLLRDSGYMDADYYLERNPDVRQAGADPVEHFLEHGWKEGRSPSADFSVSDYFIANPDVAAAGVNPLVHYLRTGRNEHRRLKLRFYGEYLDETVLSYLDEANPASASARAGFQLPGRVAVAMHVFYEDLARELLDYTENVPGPCDIFITTADADKQGRIEAIVAGYRKGAVRIRVAPNRGRDIAPFLLAFPELLDEYDYVCKVHAKRSLHSDREYAETWRRYLLESLLGSASVVAAVLEIFRDEPNVGLIYPPAHRDVYPHVNWFGYEKSSMALLAEMGIHKGEEELHGVDFPAGTMFWVRPQAIKALADHFSHTGYQAFPPEPLPKDFTLMHMLERIVPFVCEGAGYKVVCAGVRSLVRNGADSQCES
jgi:hypothetical protein